MLQHHSYNKTDNIEGEALDSLAVASKMVN